VRDRYNGRSLFCCLSTTALRLPGLLGRHSSAPIVRSSEQTPCRAPIQRQPPVLPTTCLLWHCETRCAASARQERGGQDDDADTAGAPRAGR
jgi:hypothetical protein